jgi:hypothetical protein
MPINYLLLLHAILAGVVAWVYAGVLNQPGMLLRRPYKAIYDWIEGKYGNVEDNAPLWWKPFWGCVTCVGGQFGLWTYLVHTWLTHQPFRLDMLIYSISLSLLTAVLLNRSHS